MKQIIIIIIAVFFAAVIKLIMDKVSEPFRTILVIAIMIGIGFIAKTYFA